MTNRFTRNSVLNSMSANIYCQPTDNYSYTSAETVANSMERCNQESKQLKRIISQLCCQSLHF